MIKHFQINYLVMLLCITGSIKTVDQNVKTQLGHIINVINEEVISSKEYYQEIKNQAKIVLIKDYILIKKHFKDVTIEICKAPFFLKRAHQAAQSILDRTSHKNDLQEKEYEEFQEFQNSLAHFVKSNLNDDLCKTREAELFFDYMLQMRMINEMSKIALAKINLKLKNLNNDNIDK